MGLSNLKNGISEFEKLYTVSNSFCPVRNLTLEQNVVINKLFPSDDYTKRNKNIQNLHGPGLVFLKCGYNPNEPH